MEHGKINNRTPDLNVVVDFDNKCILLYYVHKVDAQRRDSTFAPSPQTYATAAFGEGRVCEGANLLWLRCQATDNSEQSQRASCEPLTAVAERQDIILR